MNSQFCNPYGTHVKSIIRHTIFHFFIIFIICAIISPGIAQEKKNSVKPSTDKTAKLPKIIIRAKSKGDFIGIVTNINVAGKTITLKNRGVTVTFDVLNPVLKGYKELEQIRMGDRIAISYTGDGARITKAVGIHNTFQKEITKSKTETVKQKHEVAKITKKRPLRIKERTNSSYFMDVDNNNDGKITPVELSSVVPNLTVENFKKYDKNSDGCLSESEYNAINKFVTHGHSR